MNRRRKVVAKADEVPGWLVLFIASALLLSVSVSTAAAETASQDGRALNSKANVIGLVWNGIAFKDAAKEGRAPLAQYRF